MMATVFILVLVFPSAVYVSLLLMKVIDRLRKRILACSHERAICMIFTLVASRRGYFTWRPSRLLCGGRLAAAAVSFSAPVVLIWSVDSNWNGIRVEVSYLE